MSIKVTTRVWEGSRQRNSRLLLLLALADFAHDNGVCWAQGLTLETIARKARVNERQGRNLLAQIAAEGELFAAPATGRGYTNRYFVVVGLDAAAIAATLQREFGYDPAGAQEIADALIERQQGMTEDKLTDVPPASLVPACEPIVSPRATRATHSTRPAERGQSTAPFSAAKGGNPTPKRGRSSAERGQSGAERGQSGVKKGAIQRKHPSTAPAPGRQKLPVAAVDPPRIHADPSHDPPPIPRSGQRTEEEVTPTETLLLSVGLYPSTARALRDLPFEAVRDYVQRRQQQGWNAGAIKQGLERERDALCYRAAAQPSSNTTPDWQASAAALCAANSEPEDVAWVAALLSEGSPPAEARMLLAHRVAGRVAATGGSYVAA